MLLIHNIIHLLGNEKIKKIVEISPPFLSVKDTKDVEKFINRYHPVHSFVYNGLKYIENVESGMAFITHYEEKIKNKNDKKEIIEFLSLATFICEIILEKNPDEQIITIIDYNKVFEKTDWKQILALIVIVPAITFISFGIYKLLKKKF